MPVIHLPENVSHPVLIQSLAENGALQDDWERTDVDFPPHCFIDQAAIAFLCEWAMLHQGQGRRVGFYGDENTLRYLSRLDVFQHTDFAYAEHFERYPEAGRFIPARLITDDDDVFEANNVICDLVLRQFDNAQEFLPAMEWAVYEIIDNIRLHSNTPVPGVLTAQYYPQRYRLDIAIVDAGRGIMASLSESQHLWSHGDAITKAIQRGVTRNPDVGQGNGMAGTCEIVRLNGGELHVWTGDVDFTVRGGRDRGFRKIPEVAGTGIFLRLDTRHSVCLSDTFISDPGWSYINYEAERLVEVGGIRIADECVHTGGREPARTLRRKIETLLNELDGSLILDFDGVTFATSSFFDELLGRLAGAIGAENLGQRIHIINLSQNLCAMANVTIEQRLDRVGVDLSN